MDLKKELIIGIIGSIFVVFLTVFYSNQYQKQREISQKKIIAQLSSLTNEEIAKHNTANDCWIIIQRSVYNVTDYLNLHPGGSDGIIAFCGQDATNAFKTKRGKGTHSAQADIDLSKLKLGQLNETVNIMNKNYQN